MANNRMWLKHPDGRRVLLAKHFGDDWTPAEDFTEKFGQVLSDSTSYGSTSWHVEYEAHGGGDDPLIPTAVESP